MAPVQPALLELAVRLRYLRTDRWTDSKLTQAMLAEALSQPGDKVSSATVASWENRNSPKLPPRERMLAYAQFFATHRSVETEPPALVDIDSFIPAEQAAYEKLRDELVRLHTAARGGAAEPEVVRRSWRFTDSGPLTLVCGRLPEPTDLADPANPNYTELLKYADLDSLVELWGHIRAENPDMKVSFSLSSGVRPDNLSGHVVVIGGVAWNDVTRRLIDRASLPVRQRADPQVETGEIFVTDAGGEERTYLPAWSATEPSKLVEDVGLFIRMPNPYNSNRTLTMCNGIHSRGVLGAVRAFTDYQLIESNERYVAENFHGNHFSILMRVQVIEGETVTPDLSIAKNVLYQWPDKAQA